MNKQFLLFLGLAVLLGFIFYQTNQESRLDETPGEEISTHETEDGDAMEKDDGDDVMEKDDNAMEKDGESMKKDGNEAPKANIENQRYESYTNRAVGYTIDRPNNWYWEHFFVTELTDAHPDVEDIFAANRTKLPAVADIYDATVIIEVSNVDKSATQSKVAGFSSSVATISEKEATRHEGKRDGNDVIEYHLHTDSEKTIRFIYTAEEKDSAEVTVFDEIVSSFTL